MRRHAKTFVMLAAVVLMAYANSFAAGFTWDNNTLILNDPRVHSASLHHLKDILIRSYWWPNLETGLYRPITTLSFLLNYAVLGGLDQPLGYHCFNFLLHTVNAFLVYLLVLRLVRRYGPAFFAAALWAMHPIASEAVTNIVGRADELAALGVLGALLLYMRSQETPGRKIPLLCAMAICTAIAVFSKENGVMLIALVPWFDFVYRRGAGLRSIAKSYLYLAVPLLAMLAARWAVLRQSGATEIPFVDNPLRLAGLPTRWATAIRVIGKYMGLLVWPRKLSIDYSYNQIPLLNWNSATWRDAAAAAAILGLIAGAAFCYRRSRTGLFLIGFWALTMLPATNLLVTTGTILAERLLYLPSVAFAAALAIGAYRLAKRAGLRPGVAAGILAAIGAAYGARTYQRNPDWRDNEALFSSAVEASPESFKTHMGLANAWLVEDPTFLRGEGAVTEAEKAASIVSGLPDNRNATSVFMLLGAIYCARGDNLAGKDVDGNPWPDTDSARWYRKALAADLRAVAIDRAQNENHRQAELARGTPPDRIGEVGSHDVYGNLGRAYLRSGNGKLALEAFLHERRRAPALPQPYADLTSAYLSLGRTEDAATVQLESLLLDDSPETLARVAELYSRLEGGGCAVVRTAEGRLLNHDCPIVRRDLCGGLQEMTAVLRAAGMFEMADHLSEAAAREQVCR